MSVFYDSESGVQTITGVTISENVPTTVFISGVEYYDTGSTFNVAIADMDLLPADSYPTNLVALTGGDYGLPTRNLTSADLTGWSAAFDATNASYSDNTWAISAVNFFTCDLGAQVTGTVQDWVAGAAASSAGSPILVETHNTASSATTENFYDESWRCPTTGNFDLPAQRSWTSNIDIGAGDALFYNGGCERLGCNGGDYTAFAPNAAGQPDYSASQNATVWFYREFQHTGAASSGFTLTVGGSYTSFEYKLAKAWDGTATGGTVWIDGSLGYNAPQWNNGSPLSGGGDLGGGNMSFGTNNIVNCNDTLYIRFSLTGADRITSLSVTFS